MHDLLPPAGSVVWIRQQRWRVERAWRDRNVVRLDVCDRERRLTFLAPFDRPAAIDTRRRVHHIRAQQALARLAGLAAAARGVRHLTSAVHAHMDLLPHQLEPALAVLSGVRRILIADEVGLGKTIQAGMVLSELHRRQPSFRALIIVPSGLRLQWQHELAERFRIRADIANRAGLDVSSQHEAFGENAWRRAATWITSIDFLKQPHVRHGLPLIPWDLVIVDEAHDVCGDTARYETCEEITRAARHLLLLTATPHSGDESRFSRLQRMGSLDGLDDPLTIFRRTRAGLGAPRTRRIAWREVPLTAEEHRVLDALLAFELAVLARAEERHRTDARLLLSVLRKRALSTMAALDRTVERRLAWIDGPSRSSDLDWIQPRFAFEADHDELADDDDCAGLTGDIGLAATHERVWLRRLRTLIHAARRSDSKIKRLRSRVARSDEPLIVFTEFRHSLEAIAAQLSTIRPLAVLHGGQTVAERQAALGRFLDGAASVLVATDVAGQGLNLQHRSRWVVSFELPWNPTRLEQRIGRVDRIGQQRRVHATILIAGHRAERGLLAGLARRTLAARDSLGLDVLQDLAPPDEHLLCDALLTGADRIEARPVIPLRPATGFRRAARAQARSLAARRRLAEHWRGPATSHAIFWTATRGRAPNLLAAAGTLAVCALPLLDGHGTEIERHVIVLSVRSHANIQQLSLRLRAVVASLVRRRLASRLARTQRLVGAAADRRTRTDTAVAGYLHALRCPEELQPGLFTKVETVRLEEARIHAASVIEAAKARSSRSSVGRQLRWGEPVVELIIAAGS